MPRPSPYPPALIDAVIDRIDNGVNPRWRNAAACVGFGPDHFYLETGANAKDAAYPICEQCPVALSCLTTALLNSEEFGVWGGHALGRRRKIKRLVRARRPDLLIDRRPRHGTYAGWRWHHDHDDDVCPACALAYAVRREREARRKQLARPSRRKASAA